MSNAFSNIQLNKPKAVLPTNENWFTSNNIVKDPPRSIYTRRKPKVDLVEFRNFEEDKSRLNESISKYTRGKNLMVPIQYNNNNGGYGQQAYLKRTHDTFRYEVEAPKDTLPLSRTAVGNREIHSAKAATNITFENSNIVDKNKVLTDNNIKIEKHSVKSNNNIGDHKSLINKNNPKLNDNKLIYNILSNKKSFLNYIKQHPEFLKSGGVNDNMLLYNILSNKSNFEKEDRKLIDTKTGKLKDNLNTIDYSSGKSYNLDQLTNDIKTDLLLNNDNITIELPTRKTHVSQKLYDQIMLEEGRINKDIIIRNVHTKKIKDVFQDPESQVDPNQVRITDNNISLSLPSNRTYLKETSENTMLNVGDHITSEPIKIQKNTDKKYYTKDNMDLTNNKKYLSHNLRSEIKTKDVSTKKTREGGQEYITTSNSSEKKLLIQSLNRGGSFLPTPQNVASTNMINTQDVSSIINKNNGALRRNFGFF